MIDSNSLELTKTAFSLNDDFLGAYAHHKDLCFVHTNCTPIDKLIPHPSILIVIRGIKVYSLASEDLIIYQNESGELLPYRFINDTPNNQYVLRTDSTDSSFVGKIIPYNEFDSQRLFGRIIGYSTLFRPL